MSKRVAAAERAAQAHCDLNIFVAIIAILEGGTIHPPSYTAADRIIKICQAESRKRLRDYDRAIATVERGEPG